VSLAFVDARFSSQRYSSQSRIPRAGLLVANRGTLFQTPFIELLPAFA